MAGGMAGGETGGKAGGEIGGEIGGETGGAGGTTEELHLWKLDPAAKLKTLRPRAAALLNQTPRLLWLGHCHSNLSRLRLVYRCSQVLVCRRMRRPGDRPICCGMVRTGPLTGWSHVNKRACPALLLPRVLKATSCLQHAHKRQSPRGPLPPPPCPTPRQQDNGRENKPVGFGALLPPSALRPCAADICAHVTTRWWRFSSPVTPTRSSG